MPQDLKQITALRFFAAMWVVLYDFWPNLAVPAPALVGRGYLGVELFFVLSGFILSHVYLQGFGEGRFRYPEFLWARLARIYPVHLATLAGLGMMAAAAVAMGFGANAGDDVLVWPSLPAHLLLVHAWGLAPLGGWNHPSWSISAEWFAYLSFPLFAWAAWRLRSRPAAATAGALVIVAACHLGFEKIAGQPLSQATIAWGALRIVPCFTYGCAIALLWRSGALRTRESATIVTVSAACAIAAAGSLQAPDLLMVALFGALILGLAAMARNGSRRLTAPAWVYLGEVSFSIYMVCVPWQLAFTKGAGRLMRLNADALPLPAWLALVAGVVPAAMLVHHLVERPAREAIRRHGVPFTRRARAGSRGELAEPKFAAVAVER